MVAESDNSTAWENGTRWSWYKQVKKGGFDRTEPAHSSAEQIIWHFIMGMCMCEASYRATIYHITTTWRAKQILSLNLLYLLLLNVGPSTYKITLFTGWQHWTYPIRQDKLLVINIYCTHKLNFELQFGGTNSKTMEWCGSTSNLSEVQT